MLVEERSYLSDCRSAGIVIYKPQVLLEKSKEAGIVIYKPVFSEGAYIRHYHAAVFPWLAEKDRPSYRPIGIVDIAVRFPDLRVMRYWNFEPARNFPLLPPPTKQSILPT